MARGVGENPSLSIDTHLASVDFPADRTEIVAVAGDGEAPAEVINVLRSLPAERYASLDEVRRDLSEAIRRALGGPRQKDDDPLRSRRDLGKQATEHKGRQP